jgi:hypothetical protein
MPLFDTLEDALTYIRLEISKQQETSPEQNGTQE